MLLSSASPDSFAIFPDPEVHRFATGLVRDISALVSLPEACLQLRELLADPGHTQVQVAEIIALEPALATRLLRIVNSAYFCLDRPVGDISQALRIIGEKELGNMVMVTAIVNATRSLNGGIDVREFWRESIFSATLSSTIARQLRCSDEMQRLFFVGGLLLNIGKLVLYAEESVLPDLIKAKMEETGAPDYAVEQAELGLDHAAIGAFMARTWNFSPDLASLIRFHHHASKEGADWRAAIACVAGQASDQIDFSSAVAEDMDLIAAPEPWMLELLGMPNETFRLLMRDCFNDYLKTHEAFFGAGVL